MPSTSQKQEKFFNFVHAVQKGEASGKGYPKVEEVAHELKPSSVEHFMGRGHIDKSLPKRAEILKTIKKQMNKEKRAGWYEEYRNNINNINGHYSPEKFKDMTGIDVKRGSCECGKCPECIGHGDEQEDKKLIKEIVKPEALKDMNKEAFDRGFIKTALTNGVQPLLAVKLLKQAFDMQQLQQLIAQHPEAAGAIGGGLGGASLGAMAGGKEHRGSGALLGGLTGAGLGGLGGASIDPHILAKLLGQQELPSNAPGGNHGPLSALTDGAFNAPKPNQDETNVINGAINHGP
jgi:hypothetical protein